jgi:hypothetical protein
LIPDVPEEVKQSPGGSPKQTDMVAVDRPLVWWTSLALMFAALGVPVLAAPVPPLTDYPNHLARCYVLAFGGTDPVLRQMFSAHWQIIPNIAVDLILPALMRVFAPFTAGRIVLALCLFVPTAGAVALSCAYFHRRSFWQIAAGFAAFNALFLMGFMNFELAIGIALWGAAAWIAYRERFPVATCAFATVIAPVAFFSHLFGYCFYALLIGCHEICVILDSGRLGKRTDVRDGAKRILVAAIPFAIPMILYVLSPLGNLNGVTLWASGWRKIWTLLIPVVDYSLVFDVLVMAPIIGFLIYCVMVGRARVAPAALMCSVILCVGYLIMPTAMKGGWWVDARMLVMLDFMIFAGFLPSGLSSRQQAMAAAVFAVLFLAKIGFITGVWVHSQQDVADVRQVIAAVTPGSRVLDVEVARWDNPGWFAAMPLSRRIPHLNPTYWHLAAFVLLDHQAFWPTIFAMDTQQPIQVREPYRDILGLGTGPPDYQELVGAEILPADLERFPFLVDWSRKFDYVLLLNAEGAGDLETFLPDRLQLLDRRGIAALFKIKK